MRRWQSSRYAYAQRNKKNEKIPERDNLFIGSEKKADNHIHNQYSAPVVGRGH
jgi:hypothetical protein